MSNHQTPTQAASGASKPSLSLNKDLIGGLIFLVLSIGYGLSAQLIPYFPGDEYEPFTARTLPYVLSVLGTVLSLSLVISALREQQQKKQENAQQQGLDLPQLQPALGYDWSTVIKLLAIMVIYAMGLKWMGFVIATTFFLFAGFWVLGERRKTILFGASLPFVMVFWFALTQLLDIYLAPGQLFAALGFGG
ncbi:tripartite tricarboxylate transporter TctB family protein [Oceanospirillum sp. HFRX-1_2]